MVPQRRPDKGCRAEPDYGADRPPWWMPEEWRVCRRPIVGTVYDHRIVDRDVNIIRLNWFDDDVFGWPHIACARRRGDSPDLLFFARLEIAGLICPGAQRLNRVLDVVGLSQKGLAELLGPVQLIAHHCQNLRDRGNPLTLGSHDTFCIASSRASPLRSRFSSDQRAAITTSSG